MRIFVEYDEHYEDFYTLEELEGIYDACGSLDEFLSDGVRLGHLVELKTADTPRGKLKDATTRCIVVLDDIMHFSEVKYLTDEQIQHYRKYYTVITQPDFCPAV